MKRIYAFFLALLLPLSTAVAAPNDELAGHYYLRGVMEMGAELLLKNDGTFEAGVAYGSANGYAKGSWSHDAQQLVLHPENNAEVDKDDLSQLFNNMTLLIKPGCLPVVDMEGCFQKAPNRKPAQ